jgi:hypothetical protein
MGNANIDMDDRLALFGCRLQLRLMVRHGYARRAGQCYGCELVNPVNDRIFSAVLEKHFLTNPLTQTTT